MLIVLDQIRHRVLDMGSSQLDVSEVPGEPGLFDPHIAWEWLQKSYLTPFSRQPPISNHQKLLMFFNQEGIGRNERTAMIREIKRRLSRKQFDERAADEEQVNVMLLKTVTAQLNALAEAHGLKHAQIIESLVRMEAEAGVYLTDD